MLTCVNGMQIHAKQVAIKKQKRKPLCYVLTGVSGSGKSTVGKLLSQRLHCPFFDGDDFHPPSNIEKMRSGQALTDEDRWPWLQTLAGVLEEHCSHEKQCVMACSCLKRRYRQVLSGEEKGAPHTDEIAFVLLQPSREELQARVKARKGHFMPSSLLDSQLAALEVDEGSQIYGAMAPSEIVDAVIKERG